jgi:hypothetical protein
LSRKEAGEVVRKMLNLEADQLVQQAITLFLSISRAVLAVRNTLI